ncbi:hypothetical protein [Actinosynnema sp. NPDC023587]|uniref:hypothetical protein n=1 Tax=Actinosynnema sp. NPDC023587 TaxID=3154695 RepID=UPI0033F56B44
MSTTTERELLGEEVTRGGAEASSTWTDHGDTQEDQGKHEHAHGLFGPLCTGNGCVQTPSKP